MQYNRNYNRLFVHGVLRAIDNYSMLKINEQVYVALSGGKDSVTLLYMLVYINRFTKLKLDIAAAHVKTSDYDTSILRNYCDFLRVPYLETELLDTIPRTHCPCSACARLKRGALSDLICKNKTGKVAFGHHADDVAETFLMNIINNRKLGSFSPVVKVQNCAMSIIRPLIYLTEKRINHIHHSASLPLLDYKCPYAQLNLRHKTREALGKLKKTLGQPNLPELIVQSLENVDMTNHWPQLKVVI